MGIGILGQTAIADGLADDDLFKRDQARGQRKAA
jgi:hypothetical protein